MSMEYYLKATDIIDWKHPDIIGLAAELAQGASDTVTVAGNCFEWVRDEIRHSYDYQLNPATCAASEVLREKTGYCYAKSHLLAALLRANAIPAGLCYQRLCRDDAGGPFCLHGLNAVRLPGVGWYRVDPRGDTEAVKTRFDPPTEHLAFHSIEEGEADIPVVFADPLPIVIDALQAYTHWQTLYESLPDLELIST
jgi:transglutaminase-like putative cysteine protease